MSIPDENAPELDGKYLGTITSDFVKISNQLKEASYQIRKRGFSDYPIFPISKQPQPIGQLLFSYEEMDLKWNIYVTYMDEFLQRELIDPEKVDEFKDNYKDPEEFCCLFVIDGAFTSFVFIPYPVEPGDN